MPRTKKEKTVEPKQTTTKTKTVKTTKTTKTVKPASVKKVKSNETPKTDDKMEAVLQIIANLKTENLRLAEWLQNRKLNKKEKSKIEENIAFNENAIKHFNELIK